MNVYINKTVTEIVIIEMSRVQAEELGAILLRCEIADDGAIIGDVSLNTRERYNHRECLDTLKRAIGTALGYLSGD